MKVAFVYDAVYPWVKGGGEKRIYELGKRLAAQGHEVHVFGVKWWSGARTIGNEGMILHGVCAPMELYVDGRRSISEAIFFSLRLFFSLIGEKFDVIDVSVFPYFSCYSAKLVSILRGNPMIITWHEVWGNYWYEYLGSGGFAGKLIEFTVSRLNAKSIAVSGMTKRNLEALGVSGSDIHIIPNGIDLRRIAGIQPSNYKCDIIFIGRLIKEKNAGILLEAIGHVKKVRPDVQCSIIGDGPEKEKLVRFAAGYGLSDNVRFFGFMDYDEMIARLKSSKMLILPSGREGFGMVVIEAFACGVPVITVNSPRNAASLLVNEDTGLVVGLDTLELAEAICTLVKDRTLRQKMSSSLLEKAEEYDWDRIVGQLTRLYEGSMASKDKSGDI
ncbi:D-inositol-3-phosphate glycosyltransferase [uncultured archaeon]|nr:D-inositol-3-phosphate glycosyltransferase [uncultured archaeon]